MIHLKKHPSFSCALGPLSNKETRLHHAARFVNALPIATEQRFEVHSNTVISKMVEVRQEENFDAGAETSLVSGASWRLYF